MCQFVKNCPHPGHNLQLPNLTGPGKTENVCRQHYRELWNRWLMSEHSGPTPVNVPLDRLGGATDWSVSLVAIRNDPKYLAKSLVFTIYRSTSTPTPLRLLRNPVARSIIKKASGLSEAEFKTAKRKTPVDADDSPTMGHTYVLLQALQGDQPRALYSFGYFPSPKGVTNPDCHVRLANEQRRSVDYITTKAEWDAALDEVFRWHWDDITGAAQYLLFGRNCTAFARAVIKAAGHKFLGEAIPALSSAGLGKAYTPNKTFKALGKKGRHVEWDTGTAPGLPMHLAPAQASELHNMFFGEDSDEDDQE